LALTVKCHGRPALGLCPSVLSEILKDRFCALEVVVVCEVVTGLGTVGVVAVFARTETVGAGAVAVTVGGPPTGGELDDDPPQPPATRTNTENSTRRGSTSPILASRARVSLPEGFQILYASQM